MGLGDIKHTKQVVPNIIYRKKASGYTTPAAGDPIGFDSSGDLVLADASTRGPIKYLTSLTHEDGGVTYYGALWEGDIVTLMGGAVKPFKRVKITSSKKTIQMDPATMPTTPVKSDVDAVQNEIWNSPGVYVGLESDNDYAQSDAADTNLGIIHVENR